MNYPRAPHPVESLEDVAGSQIELVEDDPEAPPHGLHQNALPEDELAPRVGRVAAHVLLQVGVLVVVDPHARVPARPRQPGDQACLADRRFALEQHRVPSVNEERGLTPGAICERRERINTGCRLWTKRED